MAERFNAPVLKTGDPQGSVGSNPTPSAKEFAVHRSQFTVSCPRFGDKSFHFVGIVYALWLLLSVYLVVTAIGMKKDVQPHIRQRVVLSLVIIVAFLLPRLQILGFLNLRSINPIQGIIGVVLCVAGMFFIVWGRQYLGRNWS
jgi:hypothetical protein